MTKQKKSSQLTAFSLIVYFAAEKTVFDRIDRFGRKSARAAIIAAFAVAAVASVVCQALFGLTK